ncbi:MAG: hypothetical protein HYW25_01845 [Candidatus Aenigmarchaeota archaeon]|nr:hypothetical protein [Candidatus Aenigmarchaeota archaeon]
MLSASAHGYTAEMIFKSSFPDPLEVRTGSNVFSAKDSLKVTYDDAFFSGIGSENKFLAIAFAGKSLASSGFDNTQGTPVMSVRQGPESRFIIALSNSSLASASEDLSSGTVHRSRYGDYAFQGTGSLIYLYARIADAVISGRVFANTIVRNTGGDPPLISLQRG